MDLTKLRTPVETLYSRGLEALRSKAESKTYMRVTAVVLVLKGMSLKEVSGFFGVTERSVYNWVEKADREGFKALSAKKQTGAPCALSKEMIEKINFVLDEDPDKHGFRVWDGPSLSEYIRREFGIDYSVRSCQYLMRKLDRNLIMPQVFPSLEHPDNEARDAFRKDLAAIWKDKGKIVVFQDEVYFCAQTTVTRIWARIGSRSKVMSKPGKQSAPYSGYLIPESGILYVNKPTWFNYETVVESIRDFLSACPP